MELDLYSTTTRLCAWAHLIGKVVCWAVWSASECKLVGNLGLLLVSLQGLGLGINPIHHLDSANGSCWRQRSCLQMKGSYASMRAVLYKTNYGRLFS